MQLMRQAQTLLNKYSSGSDDKETLANRMLRMGALMVTASSDKARFEELHKGIDTAISRLLQRKSLGFGSGKYDDAMVAAALQVSL